MTAQHDMEYLAHRERGDDPMTARLRLMEQGASAAMAASAQANAGEHDDEEEER